jgi:hypothetical protein
VYREGLVRFASEKYDITIARIDAPQTSTTGDEKSKFSHLTNYSINKKNDNYVQNEVSTHFPPLNVCRMLRTTILVLNGASMP